MRSFTWISINRWILKEFNKLKKKKQKHNSLQKMTHSSKLRNSISMPSINLLPLRINVLYYSLSPLHPFEKNEDSTLKFQFSLPWESNKLKKRSENVAAKINSLFRSTFFFIHLCSFERKKEYDVEASPTRIVPIHSRTIVPWIPKANPESVARRQTGTMRILGAGARVLKLITRTAIGR